MLSPQVPVLSHVPPELVVVDVDVVVVDVDVVEVEVVLVDVVDVEVVDVVDVVVPVPPEPPVPVVVTFFELHAVRTPRERTATLANAQVRIVDTSKRTSRTHPTCGDHRLGTATTNPCSAPHGTSHLRKRVSPCTNSTLRIESDPRAKKETPARAATTDARLVVYTVRRIRATLIAHDRLILRDKSGHNGMLPCFFAGFLSRLSFRSSSARARRIRSIRG
jgi:hypothetical protein